MFEIQVRLIPIRFNKAQKCGVIEPHGVNVKRSLKKMKTKMDWIN